MIVFIDTEVSVQSKKVMDYGAVREDGAVLHTRNKAEFLSFVEDCEAVAGHNIIGFDLKHTDIKGRHIFIDTLYPSPLLFPNKPYHRFRLPQSSGFKLLLRMVSGLCCRFVIY